MFYVVFFWGIEMPFRNMMELMFFIILPYFYFGLKWNSNSLVQGLNLGHRLHFLSQEM